LGRVHRGALGDSEKRGARASHLALGSLVLPPERSLRVDEGGGGGEGVEEAIALRPAGLASIVPRSCRFNGNRERETGPSGKAERSEPGSSLGAQRSRVRRMGTWERPTGGSEVVKGYETVGRGKLLSRTLRV
jgi:hypothetical protein